MEARLISYVYCFNVLRDYFECHEYGESLWLDSGRPTILKGLIQAAVCLYHLHGGNARGGWRMWRRARTFLEATPEYEGIDVSRLVQDIDALWAMVPEDWRYESLSPSQIASLHLPTVRVQLTEPELEDMVQSWNLPPLEED